jgi:hypothetical protein
MNHLGFNVRFYLGITGKFLKTLENYLFILN